MILLGTRRRDAISSERSGRERDLLGERTEIGKRDLFAEEFPVARVGRGDLQFFSGGNFLSIIVQIPRDAFEVNDVARLVDAAFGEKKNRIRAGFGVEVAAVVNAEAIERHRVVAVVQSDEMRVVAVLGENPARFVRARQPRVAMRVGGGVAELLSFRIEEAQLHAGEAFATR